jgi:hypothetical protein
MPDKKTTHPASPRRRFGEARPPYKEMSKKPGRGRPGNPPRQEPHARTHALAGTKKNTARSSCTCTDYDVRRQQRSIRMPTQWWGRKTKQQQGKPADQEAARSGEQQSEQEQEQRNRTVRKGRGEGNAGGYLPRFGRGTGERREWRSRLGLGSVGTVVDELAGPVRVHGELDFGPAKIGPIRKKRPRNRLLPARQTSFNHKNRE